MNFPEYKYIDFAGGSKFNRNNVIEISKLPDILAKWKDRECFMSLYRFPQDYLNHWQTNKKAYSKGPRVGELYNSVSGYDGICFGDVLPIEIDGGTKKDSFKVSLGKALETSHKVIKKLETEYGINPENIKYYYSGNRSIHIDIPSTLLGNLQPDRNFHRYFESVADKLVGEFDIDTSMYDKNQLYRIVNTKHDKTGLYKIPLSYADIFLGSTDKIIEMAKQPKILDTNNNGDIKVNEKLAKLFSETAEEINSTDTKTVYSTGNTDSDINNISILAVLDKARIQLQKKGDQLYCSHPVHGSTNNDNLTIKPAENVWHCFRCDSGGKAISLIAVLEGIISCEEAKPGNLKGDKFTQTLKVAKEKYGFDIKLKGNTEKDNDNPVQIANKILSEHKILYSAGNFYKYKGGCYIEYNINEVKKIIKDILKDDFTSHKAKEIIYALEAETYINEEKLNRTNLLNVKNGLLDIEKFELYPHTPDVLSTIQLVVNYNPNATCNKWKQSLEEIFEGDKGKIELLQEVFGLCLTVEQKYEKALFCLGEGANGKSVVLGVLQKILGKDNYCAIPLELLNNGHYKANLFGKLANISIETNAKSTVYDAIFKAIISGDPIDADPKFKPPFTFTPTCKLIFALNNMPRVDDKTSAFFRRLIILRFNKVFKEEEQNKNLKYELIEELDGIFMWCLEGLKRLSERGGFKISDDIQKEIDEYKRENNNVLLFVDEQCEITPDISITKKDLYEAYKEWCKQNGHYSLSKNKFGIELKKHYDIVDARVGKERFWAGIRAETITSETVSQGWPH